MRTFIAGSTALHSIEHGFRTTVVEDACRGVAKNTIESMKNKLKSGGAVICNSSEVKSIGKLWKPCNLDIVLYEK